MRSKALILLLSMVFLTQTACENYLELIPEEGLIRKEFWQNQGDVEAVLMAAYARLASINGKLFVYGEVRADLVADARNQDNNEKNLSQGNIYPNNNLCNWEDFYSIINNCNEVIKNAASVQEIDDTFSNFERGRIVSEAIFIRSLSYFYLVRVFKEVPLVLEPSESDDTDFFLEKSSGEVILDQIVGDLITHRAAAPNGDFNTIEDNKGRASKPAFDALLADIALWRFKYEEVIEHVEKIEATEKFFLHSGPGWYGLFYPGNSSLESIMEIQYSDMLGQENATYGLTNDNEQEYRAGQKAIELLSLDFSKEVRRGEGASIAERSGGVFLIWKYIGRSAGGQATRSTFEQNSCNWILYRYADVLLMKAEALSQLERYGEADQILTDIRDRAGVTPLNITNTRSAYEDAILDERARELCFEGKRWFDLLRMGRRNDFARKKELIEIIVKNVPSAQKRVLSVKLSDPNGWYLPIFDQELERNFKLVQNPYYEN